MHQADEIANEKSAQKPLHLNRREDLEIVGATITLATAANDLTGAASAATTPSSAHRRRMMVRNVHAESPAPRRDCARLIVS
jgi:hypothetical protein